MNASATRWWVAASATLAGFGVLVACGGGGSSSPAAPSGPAATVTIGGSGVSPQITRINTGQQVRIVNSDSRSHELHSNPHPTHTDCPPMNSPGMLTAGQSGNTGTFDRAGTCGFHDHLNPGDATLRGQILVSVNDPGPPPVYRTGR